MAVKWRFLGFALLACLALPVSAENAGGSESFTIKVTGQKTWGVQVGFGDPALLSLEGLEPGQLTLTQSLWAQIEGTVLDFLTIKASFNDQLGPGFQDFLVVMDKKPWYAELGRFVVGAEGDALGVYNKKVLGARVAVARESLGLSALLARLEGISESLTFKGGMGHADLTFYYEDPNQPWLPAPYLSSVEGLFFFELSVPFVEGFSVPRLVFRLGDPFAQFLKDWGLDYLRETIEKNADFELPSGAYLVIHDNGDVLLLRHDPKVLLRNRILDLIDLYNAAQGLSGANKKTYPFVEGSDLESAFLSGLAEFAEMRVDEEAYPLAQAQRRRYLSLGEKEVLEDSLVVEVRLPGDSEFRGLADPLLSSYTVRLFPKEGVLRLDFPVEFFRAGAAIRVSFDYTREGATFSLGLSVIPGSEKVYLNGQLLKRDVDYSMDYEAGLLTLFVDISPADELRVDFERQRGALGVSTEYERYFLGATLSLGPGALGIWQAADFGIPSPTSRTMPNTHSLAVFSWQGKLGEWDYSLRFGFSQNVFPTDDNARLPAKNRINAITSARTADGEALVFAHQNGITVYQNGRFSSFGSAEGLAGRAALCLLALPNRLLIGTDSGLTIVDLSEPKAFGRVRSWTRLYPEDWNKDRTEKFQGTKVLGLTQDGSHLYMATEAELGVTPLSSLTKPAEWGRIALPEGIPTAILWAGDLYLGTTAGLFRLSQNGWERLGVAGPIYALLWRAGELLVANDEGIRVLTDGIGAGWVVYGVPVRSMAVWRDSIWYATQDGVYWEGDLVVSGDFTALGSGLGGLWAGTQADQNYNLELWQISPTPQKFPQMQTGIDGRDLGRFSDPPAEEHTRLGPTASLGLRRKTTAWELGLSLYSRFPGYEEIGSSGRSDSHGLGFTARFLGDPSFSLSLNGWADLANLTTNPALRLRGGVEGNWQGPVTLNFALSPTLSGLGPNSRFSSDFQVAAKAGSNPSWNIGISGKLAAPEFYLAGSVGGGISYQPWPGFSLSLSWSRPYRTRGSAGTENLNLQGRLTGGAGFAWSLTWSESLSHRLDQKEWTSSRAIAGELRLASLEIIGGKLAPQFSATISLDPAQWRVSASASAQALLSGHSLSVRLSGGQGFQPATERTDRTLSLNLSWSSAVSPGIQPSLNYSRTWRVLLHPRYSPQISEDQSLETRVKFDFSPWSDELGLSWAPGRALKITNRFRWDLAFGPVVAEARLSLEGGKLSAKTELEAALTLAPQWGLNINGGLLFGAAPFRAAFYLGATLFANF
ncbi:MAG: hypothetical protein ACPLZE_05755 [Candidatus Bipolaricaulaceae bacterium]